MNMNMMHCIDVPFQFDVDLFEIILYINDDIMNNIPVVINPKSNQLHANLFLFDIIECE